MKETTVLPETKNPPKTTLNREERNLVIVQIHNKKADERSTRIEAEKSKFSLIFRSLWLWENC